MMRQNRRIHRKGKKRREEKRENSDFNNTQQIKQINFQKLNLDQVRKVAFHFL